MLGRWSRQETNNSTCCFNFKSNDIATRITKYRKYSWNRTSRNRYTANFRKYSQIAATCDYDTSNDKPQSQLSKFIDDFHLLNADDLDSIVPTPSTDQVDSTLVSELITALFIKSTDEGRPREQLLDITWCLHGKRSWMVVRQI